MKHLHHWGFYACSLSPVAIPYALNPTIDSATLISVVRRPEMLQDEALCPSCVLFASFCAANKWAGSALFTKHAHIARKAPSPHRSEELRLARLKTLQHIRSRLERGG